MYLVTGATGNVGREVVSQLLSKGMRVRVFTRNPAVNEWSDRVDVILGDFLEPETFARATVGIEAIYLMSGNPNPQAFRKLVEAMPSPNRKRIVFQSTTWASPSMLAERPTVEIGEWHSEMENAIRQSGAHGTFLRPSAFMSNSLQWSPTIKAAGTVYNPMADGKTAPIAPHDIAAVGVKALMDDSLVGAALELTGDELLTVREQVQILEGVLGRSIQCVEVPVSAAIDGMIRSGAPTPLANAVGQSFEAVRAGKAAVRTDAVERITGRKPLQFASWAAQNAALFR